MHLGGPLIESPSLDTPDRQVDESKVGKESGSSENFSLEHNNNNILIQRKGVHANII